MLLQPDLCLHYEYSVCTHCVSVVVSSEGLSYVTRLDGTDGRLDGGWTALEEIV